MEKTIKQSIKMYQYSNIKKKVEIFYFNITYVVRVNGEPIKQQIIWIKLKE